MLVLRMERKSDPQFAIWKEVVVVVDCKRNDQMKIWDDLPQSSNVHHLVHQFKEPGIP